MRTHTIAVLIALGAIATVVDAAEPVTVLGLPLGGKFPKPIRVCKPQDIGAGDVKSMCWVSAPLSYNGRKSGMIKLPGSDQRPRWAGHATFEIDLRKDGALDSFKVTSFSADEQQEIRRSISSRFGPSLIERGSTMHEWKRPDIYIRLFCSTTKCLTEFYSADAYAQWQRDLEERKRKDARRPVAP